MVGVRLYGVDIQNSPLTICVLRPYEVKYLRLYPLYPLLKNCGNYLVLCLVFVQ
jgi:hypothetical protein